MNIFLLNLVNERCLGVKFVNSNFDIIVKEKLFKLVELECCILYWYYSYL